MFPSPTEKPIRARMKSSFPVHVSRLFTSEAMTDKHTVVRIAIAVMLERLLNIITMLLINICEPEAPPPPPPKMNRTAGGGMTKFAICALR